MAITEYGQYLTPELGKGRIGQFPFHEADTLAAAKPIEWGIAVQRDATRPKRAVPYDGTARFEGIVQAGSSAANYDGPYRYEQYEPVPVMRRGRIWVEVLEDVVEGGAAVIDPTTANFRPEGTATAGVSVAIGIFKSSATAGSLALLEINLPGGVA